MEELYKREDMLCFEDLINLNDSSCVKVNRMYFNFLNVKNNLATQKNLYLSQIFYKYIEFDLKNRYIKNFQNSSSYYIVTVKDLKILIMGLDENIPFNKYMFLKTTISEQELLAKMNEVNNIYNQKKEENNSSKNTRVRIIP